jgi:hypothetical protein
LRDGVLAQIIHEHPTAVEGHGFNRADRSVFHDFFAFALRPDGSSDPPAAQNGPARAAAAHGMVKTTPFPFASNGRE